MPEDVRSSNSIRANSFLRLGIMLLLGGAVTFPYLRTSTSSPSTIPTDSAALASSPAGSTTTLALPAAAGNVHTDALTLLADFVGVDVSDGAVLNAAQKDAFATPGDRLQLRVKQVRAAFAHRNIDDTEFIIATVPDPIDSNARWTFDPIVAAIESAAAANGYVLDRFYIPDWDPARDAGAAHLSTPRTAHEQWPAVVLFRDASFGTDQTHRRMLVILLVSETPTSGIHRAAFQDALELLAEWQAPTQPAPIRVLGPSFSGSIPSLALAIAAFRESHPAITFRVVTGGATNRANQGIIQNTAGGEAVASFRATVLPDDFVQKKTIEFLLDSDPALASGDRLALLVEGNTTYGSALQQPDPRTPTRTPSTAQTQGAAAKPSSQACTTGSRDVQVTCVLDHARQLPFPLHISRLRSAAGAGSRQQTASSSAGPRFLSFSLDEPGTATDQIPSLSPRSTSAAVELVLANILDTIDREHITTVGLLATDTRDKLFLAEQIARRDTTVRLFTIESDLFYVHPDYSAYVRGMVVASTYPLFNQNQRWVGGSDTQVQFPTTNAQGVYNAVLALLRDKDGKGRPGRNAPDPLDYMTPDTNEPQPPVWIGIVGRDAIWPMRWYAFDERAPMKYLQPIVPAAIPKANLTVYASRGVNFGFFALMLLVWVHVLAYSFGPRLSAGNYGAWPFLKFFAQDGLQRRRPYLLVAFAALTVVYGYAMSLFAPFVIDSDVAVADRISTWLAAVVSVAALVWLLGCTAELAWRTARGALARIKALGINRLADPQYCLMLLVLTCAVVGVASGVAYLSTATSWHRAEAVYYFERVTHPGNAVSPLMPLVFVVTAVYLWATAHLRRLTVVSSSAIARSFSALKHLKLTGLEEAAAKLQRFIDGAVQAMPRWMTGAVLAAVIVAGYVAVVHPLSTPESSAFTWAFRAAWVLLQALLLLAFAHVIYFWLVLRQIIEPFDGTPMIPAFNRLPVSLLHDRLSPKQPSAADLRRSIRLAHQLGLAMDDMDQARRATQKHSPPEEFGLAHAGYKQLRDTLCADVPSPGRRSVPWANSAEWAWLLASSAALAGPVSQFWETRTRESLLSTPDFDTDAKEVKTDPQRWFLRAEEFLAMQVLLIVRELLALLANIFFYIIVGVLLMVAAEQSFPFQPRQELLGIAWVYVVSAVVLVLTIFVQMEHDPVLSALASTEAGKIRWDAALLSKLLLYGVIPIATIFAAQFPQIGSTLLDWLTPVQRALP